MFDNILHQDRVLNQLKTDIDSGTLAPSILFSGPEYAGKGTAALELARCLCCEDESNRGRWNCSCPSCLRHRNLVSPDLLLLGKRRFFEEAAAASGAFQRHPENAGSRMLFVRAVRKLLARFNEILWEDDPALGKLKSQIGALEEELEDFEESAEADCCEKIVKKAAKLETEGLGEHIPIARIRKAAYWGHLAPLGRHKCIIIEGAENMQEGAKNSLLKILEEPPPRLTLILTSAHPMSLLPTMLSRLREYRFAKRSAKEEADVISRIFREDNPEKGIVTEGNSLMQTYLASFLPVKSETLYAVGAFCAASAAAEAVRELRACGREIPPVLADLGKFAAPIAEKGGMGRPAGSVKTALAKVLDAAERFEMPGLFIRFLQQCAALISAWLRNGTEVVYGITDAACGMEKAVWAGLWRQELERARVENDLYNISPPMALERLFEALKTGMVCGR
ncbi:MAG: DNA polymerase III [Spirochaetaceae bacterium]|nr:DNA polymerase III [Spirochaetaceae bacterium]